MLFLVFGATLDLGYRTREYFASKGFSVLKKYNYVEDSSKVSKTQYENPTGIYAHWYDDKVYVSEYEYSSCDFRYELSGIHVGFNQDQILDAVHGVSDSILTLGGASLDFIRNIKRAYGGFVTVLYMSRGELTAEVLANYLRHEHLPDCTLLSENARCQLNDGTLSEAGNFIRQDHNESQAA